MPAELVVEHGIPFACDVGCQRGHREGNSDKGRKQDIALESHHLSRLFPFRDRSARNSQMSTGGCPGTTTER